MDYILIFAALSAAFFIALITGFFIGLYLVCLIEADEDEEWEVMDLHCFQCEIEMPVKEKNGRLYCSNCGLYHSNGKS
ncbi:MAG: hypothetical protein ABIP27_17560 [Flavobacterium circumlabens]|uniref:hypothetical protein n=1 Tax=Flavobacterium circumlabens TaxID=2133765 RepID=UPI0032650C0B